MSKAKTLATTVSTGNVLADGTVAYSEVSGTPTLATVATSGSYTDLTNKPTITDTATNIAGGSAGTIPYQSAADTTAMLAAGTAGQLLQTNGAGAPTWVDAAGGGAWELLTTLDVNSFTSAITFNGGFSSSYDNYYLIGHDFLSETGSDILQCRMIMNGTVNSTPSYYGYGYTLEGSYTGQGSNGVSYFRMAVGTNSLRSNVTSSAFEMKIFDRNNTSANQVISTTYSHLGTTSGSSVRLDLVDSSFITGLYFYSVFGYNIKGKLSLYGVKRT
jgi:hypothetical protein